MDFSKVSQANFAAFSKSNRLPELIGKKQDILDNISEMHNTTPRVVLFVGFSTFIFTKMNASLYITDVTPAMLKYIEDHGVAVTYIPRNELHNYYKKFQMVITADEFFTYAGSEEEQRDIVAEMCNLTTEFLITTLRDYKNQEHKDREFSMPSWVKTNNRDSVIFLEAHSPHATDRNAWDSTIYQINCPDSELYAHGPFPRRAMYFKQLAKFTTDNGAAHFMVHKNLMYKGLVKRNYEHVITISFD